VSAEGIFGSEVIEFWPDMVRHHKRKQAEKLARQAGQGDAGSAPKAPRRMFRNSSRPKWLTKSRLAIETRISIGLFQRSGPLRQTHCREDLGEKTPQAAQLAC